MLMAEYYQSLKHAKKRLGRGRISARTIFLGPGKKLKIWTVGEYPQGLSWRITPGSLTSTATIRDKITRTHTEDSAKHANSGKRDFQKKT